MSKFHSSKYGMLAGSLLMFGVIASAQEAPATPKAEFSLNYSYTRENPGGSLPSYNNNGGFGTAQYNFSKSFGLVAELGASNVGTTAGVPFNNTAFEYLFGPRYTWRHSRFSPYVQSLFGGERYSNGFNPQSSSAALLGTSQNNFAAAFGAGLDITVTDHFAVKPIQVDYVMTQFSQGGNNPIAATNNVRYSAGVVWRVGAK